MRLNTIGKIFIGTAAATAAASALGGGGDDNRSGGGLSCLGCAGIMLLMGFGGMGMLILGILSLFK